MLPPAQSAFVLQAPHVPNVVLQICGDVQSAVVRHCTHDFVVMLQMGALLLQLCAVHALVHW